MKTVEVRTVDTDVVVILTGSYSQLASTYPHADIWVAFGTGKKLRLYSINHISSSLGERKAQALPFFHALSGCDTTSAFRGEGKKSAWQAWQAYEEVTETFVFLANHPFHRLTDDSTHFHRIERYTVVLYDKTSPLNSVNEARQDLFCKKNRAMDRLPPTRNALLQHTKRVIFQAGIWTVSTEAKPLIPSPGDFGWSKNQATKLWEPVWMTIPEVAKSCRVLHRCSCKGDCRNCKCRQANMPCSPLCKCKCYQTLSE